MIVQDIEEHLENSLWVLRGEIVFDPGQQARLCMTQMPDGGDSQIELIQPVDETSPTWRARTAGGGYHHVCFSSLLMSEADSLIQEHRMIPVSAWQAAVLFSGRAIRFAYTRNRELVEFLADERI